MKSFKCLLALPVAIVALAACGNGEANFKEVDIAAAKEVVETYATTITNSKASNIIVSGHVNKITLDGDATFWRYDTNGGGTRKNNLSNDAYGASNAKSFVSGLLAMIPNFSVKDSHVSVDPHDIASFTMPGSLLSLGQSLLGEAVNIKKNAVLVLANLPKFPMNTRLLRMIDGLKKLPEERTEEEWAKIEDESWTKANVSYFTSGSRLKVTLSTDDLEAFFDEVDERYFDNKPSGRQSEKKYPGSFTITTNEIGYVDSLSMNFKLENIDEEQEKQDVMYYSIKGNVDIDIALTFKQAISDPITIKYQLSVYRQPGEDEVPDTEFITGGPKPIPLIYDKDKSKPLTTDLSTFSDYLTFDWFSNTDLLNPLAEGKDATRVLTKIYDDPIFCYNYWNTKEKNVAFSNESYDVLAIPKYTVDKTTSEVKPACYVLGGDFHDYGKSSKVRSMLTISADGRVISTNGGLYDNYYKVLNAAGDATHNFNFNTLQPAKGGYQPIVIKGENDSEIIVPMDEIFINSNFLSAKDSEYIVNIPILLLDEEE